MRFPLTVETESLASGRGSLSADAIPLTVPAPDPAGQTLPQPKAYTALYGMLSSLGTLGIFKCLAVAGVAGVAAYGISRRRRSGVAGLGYSNIQHGSMAVGEAHRMEKVFDAFHREIGDGLCVASSRRLNNLHEVFGTLSAHVRAAGVNSDINIDSARKIVKEADRAFAEGCGLTRRGSGSSPYQYFKTGTTKSRTRRR